MGSLTSVVETIESDLKTTGMNIYIHIFNNLHVITGS
jgi:hypothetical protein